jgi:predicted phosphodiesterase
MRILIISDIHGNLTALNTVLKDAGDVDAVWCLGDIVGYGPEPEACIERISTLPNLTCLLGNHDAAVIGQVDVRTFNPEARLSIEWTEGQLSKSSLEFISGLPKRTVIEDVTLAHGSPRSPTFEYLLDTYVATINFAYFETSFCFVGHTHLPVQYLMENGRGYAELLIPKDNSVLALEPRSIVNPGSVGQPRDRDPRAAYVIFDPDAKTWDYRRVEYDIPAVQAKMEKVKLPERHIIRIAAGW